LDYSPLVSILINNYNYGSFLNEAIDSALHQTYVHTEVIVVDDGSTDRSREIIASYGERVIPILKKNGGQASAFNAGFAISKGDIICFLDSDDIFFPEKVAEVVKVFENHSDIAWCFHRLKKVDTYTGSLLGLSRGGYSHKCNFRFRMKMGGKAPVSTATSGICFRRSFLNHILPMPESSGITLNDNYLKRSAYALTKGFYIGNPLAVLRIHNNNRQSLVKNKERLRAKIDMLTAYWMRVNFPWLWRYNDRVFARSVNILIQTRHADTKYEKVIKDYFSIVSQIERFEIGLIGFFYRLRYKITNKLKDNYD